MALAAVRALPRRSGSGSVVPRAGGAPGGCQRRTPVTIPLPLREPARAGVAVVSTVTGPGASMTSVLAGIGGIDRALRSGAGGRGAAVRFSPQA